MGRINESCSPYSPLPIAYRLIAFPNAIVIVLRERVGQAVITGRERLIIPVQTGSSKPVEQRINMRLPLIQRFEVAERLW